MISSSKSLIHREMSDSNMFQAQSKLYHHIFNIIDSMSLKCAIRLGIPDTIHSHKKPITIHELATALSIHPSRISSLGRLMRALVHSGIFSITEIGEGRMAYGLTPCSELLVKDKETCLSGFVLGMLDTALISPWHCLADWFTGSSACGNSMDSPGTPFEAAHGMNLWRLQKQDPSFNSTFNQAMASDSGMMNLVIGECNEVFEGLQSVVDVGGGTGMVARILARAFPGLKCTVLDLPHVVEGLEDHGNLKFVGGDMFEDIPSADAVLLKLTLHALSDEDCAKVLKKCREAIRGRNEKAKVIIIDIVIRDEDDQDLNMTKLYFDMLMITVIGGKERTEKDWEKHFLDAGFSHYNIRPTFGLRSLIEVYP